MRRGALVGLSAHAPAEALKALPSVLAPLSKEELVRTWQELFTNAGFAIDATSPEALSAYVKREYDKWGDVIRKNNIKVE